ncbi:MAG: HAD family hydrolase [Chloroflexota bacterium]|nr:HAD family hydrolase [Chloroflexota bacterium]
MSKITTVVFDAFGTLFQDSPDHWDAAMGAIIREQDLNVSVDTLNEAWLDACVPFRTTRSDSQYPFQSYTTAWRDAFAEAFRALGLEGDADAASHYWISNMGERDPYPETREALEALSEKYRVVVLSNADDCFLDPVLDRLAFPFAATMSSEGGQSYKPNPQLFHTLLNRIGVQPEEAVYVGDRQLEDIKGAREAGLGAVWINRAGTEPDPDLPTPDYQIASLLDLAAVLEE